MKKSKIFAIPVILTIVLSSDIAFAGGTNRLCVAALGGITRSLKAPFVERSTAKKSVKEIVGIENIYTENRVENMIFGSFNLAFDKSFEANVFSSKTKIKGVRLSGDKAGFDHGWAGYLVPVSLVNMLEKSLESPGNIYKFYSNKHLVQKLAYIADFDSKQKKKTIKKYINENPELEAKILDKALYSTINATEEALGFSFIESALKEEKVNTDKLHKESSELWKRIKQFRKRESNIITINNVKYYPAGPYSQNKEVPVVKLKSSYWMPNFEEGLFDLTETLEFLDSSELLDPSLAETNNNDSIMRKFTLGAQTLLSSQNGYIMGRFRGFWKEQGQRKRGNIFDTTLDEEFFGDILTSEEIYYNHNDIHYGSTIVFIEVLDAVDGSSKVLPITIEHGMSLNLVTE